LAFIASFLAPKLQLETVFLHIEIIPRPYLLLGLSSGYFENMVIVFIFPSMFAATIKFKNSIE